MTTLYSITMHNSMIFGNKNNYQTGIVYASKNPELCWFFDSCHDSYEDQSDTDYKKGLFKIADLGMLVATQSDIVSHYFHDRIPHMSQKEDGLDVALARYDASYLFFQGVFDYLEPRMVNAKSEESSLSFSTQKVFFLDALLAMWVLSYDKMTDEFRENPPLLPKYVNFKKA